MINPEDNLPIDDTQNSEADDQQSQKDIHSNGLEGTIDREGDEEEVSEERLNQAFDASEPSYTLDVEKGIAPKHDEENTNLKG